MVFEDEESLFKILCTAHLSQGGRIGLDAYIWERGENGKYSRQTYDFAPIGGEWYTVQHAVDNIGTMTLRLNKSRDDIAFYPGTGPYQDSGATWRVLKNDMPFLRIVLKDDADTMGSVLRRLDNVLNDSMVGDEIKKQAEKN